MSNLGKLIKRATNPEPERLGFGAAARKNQPSMLLVAMASDRWSRAASDAITAGADVVVLQGKPGDSDVKEAVAAAGDKPCGVALDGSPDSIAKLRDAKADFVVVATSAPAGTMNEEELGIVLQLRDELSDMQLRATGELPLEAIYLDREISPATIMRLLDVQRVAALTRKPLLVALPADCKQDELIALRDAGVALLAVDMRDRGAVDGLKRLRETIDKLPAKKPRKEEKREPLLPTGGHAAAAEEDEEDDE